MAAIWGIVNLNHEQPDMNEFQKMQEAYAQYKIDRYAVKIEKNAIMGCAHQYFTKEAEREMLPIVSGSRIFTADAMIDNMEEITPKLIAKGISLPLGTDSEILREIIRNNEEQLFREVLGIFSFADYDQTKNELVLGTDALGVRVLYYCQRGNTVYFSTITEAIVSVCKNDWNHQWIGDFVTQYNFSMHSNNTDTIYDGIYLVPAAHTLHFTQKNMTAKRYWFPFKENKIRKISDEQCKRELVDIFSKAVNCVLRSPKETGMFLSGGLDSTAVACFAAPELKKRNQVLHTYTSTPEEGFESQFPKYFVPNELTQVRETADYLGNLSLHTMPLNGINSWDYAPKLLKIHETPYKSTLNLIWIYEGLSMAAEQNIRIMLSGQYGNASISYGDYYAYLYTLLHSGKIFQLIREINAMHKKRKASRKKIYTSLLKDTFFTRKMNVSVYDDILSEQYMDTYGIKKQLEGGQTMNPRERYLFSKIRRNLINEIGLRQVAEAHVKASLATGVILRDPTKDRRLVEFILSLPVNQFNRSGIDRNLIYSYLSDYMPESVLVFSQTHRGLQSADLKARLVPQWSRIFSEISGLYRSETARIIFDSEKLGRLLSDFETDIEKHNDFELQHILYIGLLIRFLEHKY